MLVVPQLQLAPVYQAHRRFLGQFNYWTNVTLKTTEQHVHEHVARYSKFKRRSAKSLKDAAKARHTGGIYDRRIRFRAFSDGRRYENPIEYGSRSYSMRGATYIYPRRKQFLAFYWKKLGRWVFLKRVLHPGNRPYKFLWTATYSAHRVFGQTMAGAMGVAAKSFR